MEPKKEIPLPSPSLLYAAKAHKKKHKNAWNASKKEIPAMTLSTYNFGVPMKQLFISLFLSLFFISDAFAIDINTADASALTSFNGVGPATAKKIVAYREANGPFASCDDLTKVKGIGAKTLEKIKPMCTASAPKE